MKRMGFVMVSMVVTFGFFACGSVFAQGAKNRGQDTMVVVDENQRPEDIVNQIALPDNASQAGVKKAQQGLDTASQVRERNRERAREAAQDGIMDQVRDRDQLREQLRDQVGDQAREQLRDENDGTASQQDRIQQNRQSSGNR